MRIPPRMLGTALSERNMQNIVVDRDGPYRHLRFHVVACRPSHLGHHHNGRAQ